MQPQARAVPMARAARLAARLRGGGVAAAQPRGRDHRRRQRRADHGGQRVQAPDQQRFPLDLGVPEPRALAAHRAGRFLAPHRVAERLGVPEKAKSVT